MNLCRNYIKKGGLASHDIVTRGIHQRMLDTSRPCMYLDISFKESEWIQNRFSSIYNGCLYAGVDMAKDPIPVVPAAHYSCRRIGVNLKVRTSLKRLYAIGEVACTGVHGANRLASTSLLEALVWVYYSGKDAAIYKEGDDHFPEIVGLRNGVQSAIAIISATLEARESKVTHYLLEDEA